MIQELKFVFNKQFCLFDFKPYLQVHPMQEIINQYRTEEAQAVFEFLGSLDDVAVAKIITDVEEKLIKVEPTRVIRKRVVNILIECLQNIRYHGLLLKNEVGDDENLNCFFRLVRKTNHYEIVTGNFLLADDMENYRNKISEFNNMPTEQLREKYLETLQNGKLSTKGGAGLGVMRILRESRNSIKYSLIKHNQDKSILTQKIIVDVSI